MAIKKYVDESGLSYFTQQLDVKYIDNDELEIAVDVIENELNSLDENKVGFDDYATSSEAGIVKTSDSINMNSNHQIGIVPATDNNIKEGINQNNPITPNKQDQAAFYGLAKAAGDTTQSQSSNAVGTYTNEAKAAIQTMLDIPSTDDIPEVPVQDVQVNGTSILNNGVANVPIADSSTFGVVKVSNNGVKLNSVNILQIVPSSINTIKSGSENYNPIVPTTQHASTFYGLAKVAGADMASSSNAVGIYTDEAKGSIQHMLGTDNLAPYESDITADQAYAVGELFMLHGKLHRATAAISALDVFTVGTNCEVVNASDVFARDVQVNGTSITNGGIANIPVTSPTTYGAIKISSGGGLKVVSNGVAIDAATDAQIKAGTDNYRPTPQSKVDKAVFYGLAKASGDTTQSQSSNAVGTYTDEAKGSIQHMLGTDNLAPYESDITADQAYAVGELFMLHGKLHRATAAISALDVFTVGTNCEVVNASDVFARDVQVNGTSVINQGVANVPVGSSSSYGVYKLGTSNSLSIDSTGLVVTMAEISNIKEGLNRGRSICPGNQHQATFYGLAKAAGDNTQSASNNAVGTYTDAAKDAIQQMLGVTDIIAEHEGVLATTAHAINDVFMMDGKLYKATTAINVDDTIASGTNCTVVKIDEVFVKNTDWGTGSSRGILGVPLAGGLFAENGYIYVNSATSAHTKAGTQGFYPVTPARQHESVFYGLAKAAGDSTQSESYNSVGTYTESAKSAIRSMLGMSSSIIGPYEETVTGATPSIIGLPNYRYLCGEVTSISITPPATGTIDVIFTSGSTVAVLTLPNTVKMPDWFDATSLETNTVYEIMITNGVWGCVGTWTL